MGTVATIPANAQWAPESESGTKLKAALENILITSPKSVIVKAPDNQTNRFILQTQGYHDVYQYIVSGTTYTSSRNEFEKIFTKSTFAAVDEIDAQAYILLRNTTVAVAEHCTDFNANGLGQLITSANGAIAFADHCIGLIKEKADINLYNNFQILLDDKYRTGPKDTAFEEAVYMARLVAETLAKSARLKATDAADMVRLLQAFYAKTDNDAKSVKMIQENFLLGPRNFVTGNRKLKTDGTFQESYSEVLSSEITRLQDEVTAETKSKNEENDKWETAKTKAIALGVAGYFVAWCHISTATEANKAAQAKNKYNEMIEKIIKDDIDKAATVKVLELVRALVNNFSELLPKMLTAMNALQELEKLFYKQNMNFQLILNNFDGLYTGVVAKTWTARKLWITTAIEESVEIFKEIKLLGEEFKRSADPQIVKL